MKQLSTVMPDARRFGMQPEHWGPTNPDDAGVWVCRPKPTGPVLRIIATTGAGWDHVSISTATRCPTWDEMEWVKRRFFKDDEIAMQLHVTPEDHINMHPYTLHLWRPTDAAIPLPPAIMV